jgi:hypothetical protein
MGSTSKGLGAEALETNSQPKRFRPSGIEWGLPMATITRPEKSIKKESAPWAAELSVSLPPPAAAAVVRLMAETGDSPGQMVGKALGLYMLAVDARKRGKAVGAADSPDALETEFTGF